MPLNLIYKESVIDDATTSMIKAHNEIKMNGLI